MRIQFGLKSVLVFSFVFVAQAAFAAAPRFTNLSPRGAQRGTEIAVTLQGSNLDDAEELLIYDEGLEVVKFELPADEKQKGKQVTATLKLKEGCNLGTYRMRIRTKTGLSDLQNFYVTPYPIVDEKEPNTEFSAPQVIEKNVAVYGRIDREDADYYAIEAKKGERISVEVFGMRLGFSSGTSFFDPYLAIINEERFELAVNDDSALTWNDSVASIIAPKDGRYTILVRDSAYNGDGRAYYFANIGNFPRPHAVIPSGGKPGEKLTVTFVGDVAGPITREVTLPADGNLERFGLEVQDEYGIAPTAQPFRLSPLDNFVEQEPNNDRTTATAAAAPGAYNGVISEPGDVDFFKFSAKKDQQFDVEVYARRSRSALDPVMFIYRMDNGARVTSNDDSRGPDSYARFKAPADGEYVVSVYDHLKNGGEAFSYRIELTPVEPTITADPVEFARYVQHQIVIPQGAGSGIVATVRRDNIGGPVDFRSDSLPEGVRIECPEGWRSGGSMPVVFYADENAPLAGKYSGIEVFLSDPNQKDKNVAGPLQQKVLMIRGQNNNRVWEEDVVRMPVIVTEKAPFKVWIEAPKAPLVRGGSMNLKVKCEKQEGWDEDISLLMLQNPSGVNSSRSVKIPKGKTEAVMPVNAAGNAAVQESMISLRCIAKVGNGNIELCTPFAPLKVEEQYMTFEFAQGAVEQGKEIVYPIKITKRKDFEGEAQVRLLGLPANATAENLTLKSDVEELNFVIKAAANTPPGMSKNVFCQVIVPESGETVLHNLGTGRLRVDTPPPPKKDAPATPKPAVVAKKEPPKKPLTRLEMLRLQKKEQAAAGGEE
ncbi:PPC domain-containing protein [Thalassoglobus sp.]|uniref:PPC domain-containing protein n=1 Tax=Thalassoglobus sp. TaxID=2795869 RepID=UPI003AA95864